MADGLTLNNPGGPLVIELLEHGVGRRAPLRLTARQIVIRLPNGTPVVIAAEYGPDGCYAVSTYNDDDFNRMLRNLNIDRQPVTVVQAAMAPPINGSVLVAGPRPGE